MEGQQDELGDGLNLVNCGIYLDVNNADVSQSVISSAPVYLVFISVCSFRRNVVHCSKKAITCAPSSKAHSKIHEKHSKRVKAAIILIPNSSNLFGYMRPFKIDQKCTTAHPPLYFY